MVARFSPAGFLPDEYPKGKGIKIGQKEGLSQHKFLKELEAMNARVLFFNKNVGMEVSLRLNNISVENWLENSISCSWI